MRNKKHADAQKTCNILTLAMALAAVILSVVVGASAQTETVLFNFGSNSTGGFGPVSGVVLDSAGNIYGTTSSGGNNDDCRSLGNTGCGVAFELSLVGSTWQENVPYTFTGGSDGGVIGSGLVRDSTGNLYGTTQFGGTTSSTCSFGCGVVYELSPSGGGWVETVIHSFTGGADGSEPVAGLILDGSGNLYGTTSAGGNSNAGCVYSNMPGCGVVFKLANSGGIWTETVLHTFSGGNGGSGPQAGATLSSAGNLFGTASGGGADNGGLVFELVPGSGGTWTFHVLHVFTRGVDGGLPHGTLLLDPAGNIFGTTEIDGKDFEGVVFELSPRTGGGWKFGLVHTFTGSHDGGQPVGPLLRDTAGNIYGTTVFGGMVKAGVCLNAGCGVAYKLSPRAGGGWTETALHTFKSDGIDGTFPYSGLVFDAAGNLYGTTNEGGVNGGGTVFEIVP
jgi:uncharacterized repeat protein (TIGR03803 family)